MSPISVNWVKTRARSPSATASSSTSTRRVTLPDRPGIEEPSARKCAGWLQTCLSFIMVARTSPRRSMPSASSMRASMSSTTAW